MSRALDERAHAWRSEAAVAALVLQPFALLFAASLTLAPLTAAQLAAADPLVQLAGARGLPWIAVLCFALGLGAWRAARPGRAALLAGAHHAALGMLAAAALLVALRVAFGPALPAFVPPEESARPGLTGGLAAGVLEEAVFRLLLLPALLALGLGRTALGFAGAALLVGAAFALSHELGPGAGAFRPDHFVTRLVVPGAAMSLACRWPGFSFLVAAHCTAHLLLPFLFV